MEQNISSDKAASSPPLPRSLAQSLRTRAALKEDELRAEQAQLESLLTALQSERKQLLIEKERASKQK